MEIVTERLKLRPFEERDLAPFAALNGDADTMRYFPATLTRAESDALVERIEARRASHGLAFSAVERRSDGVFVGMVGLLHVVELGVAFEPTVEVGWRLDRNLWGKGYASEAAQGAMAHGFSVLGLPEIVAFTAVPNLPSQAVMQRLGMHRDPADDFDHPRLAPGHWLRRHVLYRITAPEWAARHPPVKA